MFVMTEPKLKELLLIFDRVADWERVCPFLIDDDTGQKTKQIKNNPGDIDAKRLEMLHEFLERSNASWEDVVDALKLGTYSNLADETKEKYLK